jgi:hypothetical protein
VKPDAVLSGHAHNYQRHTRRPDANTQIPYIVAGCGGHNDSSVDQATGQADGDHTFDKSFQGFGYLLVQASTTALTIDFYAVGATPTPYDTVTVPLK